MNCSHCGRCGDGRFCSACGARLDAAEAEVILAEMSEEEVLDGQLLEAIPEWAHCWNYRELLQHPEVRDRITWAGNQASERLTGEQFLELCDKAFKPLGGVSLKTVAMIVQPLYAKMGIKTGQSRAEQVALPPGIVLVTALCSLARNGQGLTDVQQLRDGCVLHAKLPSDMFSLAGQLVVTVRPMAGGTHVEAATTIPGQWFDWGKSRRNLDVLFAQLRAA